MKYKPAYIAILGLLFYLSLPNLLAAQHSVDIGFAAFAPLDEGNNDLGNEISITYQYRFLNKDDSFFVFTSLNTFYQPRRWSGETLLPSNSDGPGHPRYGAGLMLGIYKEHPLFNSEIGLGFSQHLLESRRNDLLDTPNFGGPIYRPHDSSPGNYMTFDLAFSLSRNLSNSIFIKGTLKMQSAFTKSVNNTYIRPGISLGYHF